MLLLVVPLPSTSLPREERVAEGVDLVGDGLALERQLEHLAHVLDVQDLEPFLDRLLDL